MRYKDLVEAPLQDFGVLGDTKEPGSFRADDLKAMNNPKWEAKLRNVFSKTPYNFNIYALNAPDNKHRYSGDGWVNTLHTGVKDYKDSAGVYSAELFKTLFGFVPPDYEKSISVLFTFNEGTERRPFTQWMIAHRLIHALSESRTKIQNPNLFLMRDIFDQVNSMIGFVEYALDAISGEYLPIGNHTARANAVGMLVGKTQALRTGNLSSSGETVPELGAQYLLTGRVTFRTFPVTEPITVLRQTYDQEAFDKQLAGYGEKITTAFGNLFDCCTGKMFVL
jgi:hypothetical protein